MKFSYFAKSNEDNTKLTELFIDRTTLSDILGIQIIPELIAQLQRPYVIVYDPDTMPEHNEDYERLEEGEVMKVDGHWMRTYYAVPKTLAEIDTAIISARKTAEASVNEARLVANASYFMHKNYRIRSDRVSMDDLFGTNAEIQNNGGELPADWIGFWKTDDNTLLPITTVEDWRALFSAMYAQGMQNFKHAAYLKQVIANAPTIEAIRAVHWNDPSPFDRVKI